MRVSDCEKSAAFYARVLGLPERRRLIDDSGHLRAVWVDAGDVVLMLETRLRGTGAESGSAHVLALAVDDLESWRTRLAEAGVAIEDETGATLYVRDPDGHRVGLSTHHF